MISSNDYSHFSPEDFASDSYFQNWVFQSDDMTHLFWVKWLQDHPEKQADVELAKKRLHQFTFKKYKASENDFNDVWKNLKASQAESFKSKRVIRRKWYAVSVAASIALLVAITIFSNKNVEILVVEEPFVIKDIITPGTDKATLTLGDGSVVVLEKGKDYKTKDVTSNGDQIIYKTKNRSSVELVYNYLTIPRGGEYSIKLQDGTQVWLNSESQLKYPVSFTEGETRQVELVYGEAYFDVSPSTAHKGAKFVVINNAQVVEVLGTEFNIKAYKDESNIYTTLVEGKVTVSTMNKTKILAPNEQLILNLSSNNIMVSSSVDVYRVISWKNGVFSFRNKPLKDIMKVLSRWYDIKVDFNNEALEMLTFNGSLNKKLGIEETLSIISLTNNISYEIDNKTVLFN